MSVARELRARFGDAVLEGTPGQYLSDISRVPGRFTPLPDTKAAPSASAKAIDTSSASHWATSMRASSRAVWVEAGLA